MRLRRIRGSMDALGFDFGNQRFILVGRVSYRENSNQVLQSLAHISPLFSEVSKENFHSGASPPWFELFKENQLDGHDSTKLHTNKIFSSSKSARPKKLNPNRFGAAWAEKRKIELEKEKGEEIASNRCDPNWLPNLGRVWQFGSMKDSRKEFEMEHEKSLETDSLCELPIKLQPYLSKRMQCILPPSCILSPRGPSAISRCICRLYASPVVDHIQDR